MTVLIQIEQELLTDVENEASALTSCGQEKIATLLSAARRQSDDYPIALSELCALSHEAMKKTHREPAQSFAWRRLFTDTILVWSLLDILCGDESNKNESEYWSGVVKRLDNAIIVAGAPGDGRLDLILDTIDQIQNAYLPPQTALLNVMVHLASQEGGNHEVLPSAIHSVPVLSTVPSLSAFRSTYSHAPFILRRFAEDWPAVSERRWASKSYLQSVAGRGRIVPVEIGRDYRTDDWTQRMTSWDEFLDYLFFDIESNQNADESRYDQREVIYLAQHDLFKQFPILREDIVVPDYVYTCLPAPEHYPQYRPPANDEELVINTWIGPQGTISPAHTDPFYNFYTQVVGRKTVWLAPPNASNALSPCSKQTNGCLSSSTPLDRQPSLASCPDNTPTSNIMLSNTARLDIFASACDLQREPEFMENVVPVAMSTVLDEGDMLFFPPGWWHAFRSETTSISVSMWF